MLKIKDERAWVVQAIFDPVEMRCLKVVYIGAAEVCRAAAASILQRGASYSSNPFMEFGDENNQYCLTFPREGRRAPSMRVGSNYLMMGVLDHSALKTVVSGEGEDLYDQVFAVVKKRCEIPFLREWVPMLFESGLETGSIIRLEVVGVDSEVNRRPIFHIQVSETQIKELLIEKMDKLLKNTTSLIQAA